MMKIVTIVLVAIVATFVTAFTAFQFATQTQTQTPTAPQSSAVLGTHNFRIPEDWEETEINGISAALCRERGMSVTWVAIPSPMQLTGSNITEGIKQIAVAAPWIKVKNESIWVSLEGDIWESAFETLISGVSMEMRQAYHSIDGGYYVTTLTCKPSDPYADEWWATIKQPPEFTADPQ